MSIKLINDNCLNVIGDITTSNSIIVTDPPFNIGYKYNTYKDKMRKEDYYNMLYNIIYNKMAVVIHYPEQLHELSIRLGYAPTKVVSWVYNSNNPRQHRDIAFYNVSPDFKKVGQPYKNPTDKRVKKLIAQGKKARMYDWLNIQQVKNVSTEKTEHPAQMPISVMEKIVGLLPSDSVVIDPFMGSGTTGVACKNLNVDFIGIELDDKYFEIAKERIV